MKHDTVITYTIYYDINIRVRTKGFGKTEIILDKREAINMCLQAIVFMAFTVKSPVYFEVGSGMNGLKFRRSITVLMV